MKFSPAQLDDLRARNPVHRLAATWVKLRKKGSGYVGPCPLHSLKSDALDSTSFVCDSETWACAVCDGGTGGNVIQLVQRKEGLDFISAVEWPHWPGGGIAGAAAEPVDPEIERQRAQERERQLAARAAEDNAWREKRRGWAWDLWGNAKVFAGSDGERCLALRLGGVVPPGIKLRFDPASRYSVEDRDAQGRKIWRKVHEGPAFIAAFMRGGKFYGCHRTFIDLNNPPKFKAHIVDPKTGETLNAKTMHGGKRGAHIPLYGIAEPQMLILGEGTEKSAAVWAAMIERGRDLACAAAWSAGDLGNLGGKAAATVKHPTLTGPAGRPSRVGGSEPDMTEPGIEIPGSVTRLILLGDSTSDPFTTQHVMARAAARYRRQRELQGEGALSLEVVCAWAPEGKDFDDLLREAV